MSWKRRVVVTTIMVVTLAVLIVPHAVWADGPKNVIMFIGDGLGAVQRQIPEEVLGQKLVMNYLPVVGVHTTHSSNSLITDSAAAGTALACGHKTNNGVIAMDATGRVAYESLAEAAQRMGKAAGLVSTSRITHATPAVFASHIIDRGQENIIANQYLETDLNLYMGGGWRHFVAQTVSGSKRKDDRDLLKEFAEAGYDVVRTRDELLDLPVRRDTRILGLFSQSHLPYFLDRHEQIPSLEEMTEVALDVLCQDQDGFFLMVEGARIDHACHANDPVGEVCDTEDFDNAVQAGITFMRSNPDTLVVVCADHECGGMAMGIGKDYFMETDAILGAKRTAWWMGIEAANNPDQAIEIIQEYGGVDDLTPEEAAEIQRAIAATQAGEKPAAYIDTCIGSAYAHILSSRARVGWTSYAHTAQPVILTAAGEGADTFGGYYDNVDVAEKVAALWSITLRTSVVRDESYID